MFILQVSKKFMLFIYKVKQLLYYKFNLLSKKSARLIPIARPHLNLPAHKIDGVEELIESVDAKLLYPSPYSPDFSPIELSWSKIKTFLRKTKSRNSDALEEGICKAFATVITKNCEGWFRHCGEYK